MPDIAMCGDRTCPERMKCYRYRAIPTPHRQSYFGGRIRTDTDCRYFAPIYPDQTRLVPEADLP